MVSNFHRNKEELLRSFPEVQTRPSDFSREDFEVDSVIFHFPETILESQPIFLSSLPRKSNYTFLPLLHIETNTALNKAQSNSFFTILSHCFLVNQTGRLCQCQCSRSLLEEPGYDFKLTPKKDCIKLSIPSVNQLPN